MRPAARGPLAALGLALLLVLGYRFILPSGWGYPEALAALALPAAALATPGFRWRFSGLLAGVAACFLWVPEVIAVKGGLPLAAGWLGGILLWSYEALGLALVATLASRAGRWRPAAAPLAAALGILAWEAWGFHIYNLNLASALGGVPWLSRGAAFLGAHGLAAAIWGAAACAVSPGLGPRTRIAGPAVLAAFLVAAPLAWGLLPRGPEQRLDLVLVQPNWEPGLRRWGMEEAMWARTDAALAQAGLPKGDAATLVLWPESAVLGRDDRLDRPRLTQAVAGRGIALLFGTEGGPFNLARGEAGGGPPFLQAKTEPMPFGERMPGPDPVRRFLDRSLGILSQEPGALGPASTFPVPTPDGPVQVHPLICSEALMPQRVARGVQAAGADLLANLTNDGWFERSIATDLHAAHIRLRSVEAGVPLVRVTLTGKSGLFREDGRWELWGEPRSEAAYAFRLHWRAVRTPARSPWIAPALALLLAAALAGLALRGCLSS